MFETGPRDVSKIYLTLFRLTSPLLKIVGGGGIFITLDTFLESPCALIKNLRKNATLKNFKNLQYQVFISEQNVRKRKLRDQRVNYKFLKSPWLGKFKYAKIFANISYTNGFESLPQTLIMLNQMIQVWNIKGLHLPVAEIKG